MKWYLRRRSRVFLNQVDHVVTPSPSIAKLLKSYGVYQPMTAIPTGIDLDAFKKGATNAELAKHGIDPKRPFILFVGRLAPEKNVQLLLESFAHIHQVLPGVQLVLVGSGPAREHYEGWVREHKLGDSVVFTGFLPKDVTNRIFVRAEVFGFPSTTDTQGIVIQEAMAAGVPPVAVAKFGPADYIEDRVTGLLVPENQNRFTHALEEVLTNSRLREKLGTAARRKAHRYSRPATANQLEALYQGLIKARRGNLQVDHPRPTHKEAHHQVETTSQA
jgi:glycosyltransferase involved in cell wall biosynthesis